MFYIFMGSFSGSVSLGYGFHKCSSSSFASVLPPPTPFGYGGGSSVFHNDQSAPFLPEPHCEELVGFLGRKFKKVCPLPPNTGAPRSVSLSSQSIITQQQIVNDPIKCSCQFMAQWLLFQVSRFQFTSAFSSCLGEIISLHVCNQKAYFLYVAYSWVFLFILSDKLLII